VTSICNPSYLGEAEIGRMEVQGQPRQIVGISEITRAKWTGDVAQALESLFCKCEALSSNPSSTKKKKKKKKNNSKR
jgi:hypothetical protein